MGRPRPDRAVILAVVAVLAAVAAGRWEVAVTADERAADEVTVDGRSAGSTGSASTRTSNLAPVDDPTSLRAGPTIDVRSELAAILESVDRVPLGSTGTAPTPPTPTEDAATSDSAAGEPLDDPSRSAGPADVEPRGEAALASIPYPWRELLPGWEIRFHSGLDGAYGYTLTDERVIEIYVRDDQSDQLLAHVIAHELGHAVDVTHNDAEDRHRWQAARDFDAPWWPDSRASDFATGAGDFAESFAAWQVGSESFRSQLGQPPSAEQLELLAELVHG